MEVMTSATKATRLVITAGLLLASATTACASNPSSGSDRSESLAPTTTMVTTSPTVTTASSLVLPTALDGCRAVAHVLSIIHLPAGFGRQMIPGRGGGAPASARCSAHFDSNTKPGTFIDIVEQSAPFAPLEVAHVGEYSVGDIEDGEIATYTGHDLPAHYLVAYGLELHELSRVIG